MTDCLLIGFYDVDFTQHEQRVRSMGLEAGAYKDLALSFVRHNGEPLRALDVINRLGGNAGPRLHNADFLWPVILVLGTSLVRNGHTFDFVNLPHLDPQSLRAKLADRPARLSRRRHLRHLIGGRARARRSRDRAQGPCTARRDRQSCVSEGRAACFHAALRRTERAGLQHGGLPALSV